MNKKALAATIGTFLLIALILFIAMLIPTVILAWICGVCAILLASSYVLYTLYRLFEDEFS